MRKPLYGIASALLLAGSSPVQAQPSCDPATQQCSAPSQPYIWIDAPAENGVVGQPFAISGWALDAGAHTGNGVDLVCVVAYPASGDTPLVVGSGLVDGRRDDVASVFGAQFDNSGYSVTVRGLPPGSYMMVVFEHSTVAGTYSLGRAVDVQIASAVAIVLDAPAYRASVGPGFLIGGWALDFGAASGDGVDVVHVYAYPLDTGGAPIFLGWALVNVPRPDVASILGSQYQVSGFNLMAPALADGRYRIVAYAHSTLARAFTSVTTTDVALRSPSGH
jgi:hypothetical protein